MNNKHDKTKDQEIYTPEEFAKSSFLGSLSEEVQFLIKQLIYRLYNNQLKFVLKVRNDNTFTLSNAENANRNIATIWPYKNHFAVKILNKYKKSCSSVEDIDDNLIAAIEDKYRSLVEDKVQTSIYFNEDLLKTLRDKAKNEHRKINDIVVEAVESFLNEKPFISKFHEYNYKKLVNEANIYEHNYTKKALLYVLSAKEIYLEYVKINFKNKVLEVPKEIYDCKDFDTCSEYLLAFIMDLYNNKGLGKLEYMYEFGCMNETNIALNALKINFGLIKLSGGKRAIQLEPLEF